MTKDEAIKILQGAIKTPNTKDGYLGQAIDMAIEALEQQEPCENVLNKECNNCAYYDNGANDEACNGCFEDEEHLNFKPKAQYCEDCISRRAVNDLVDELARAISDERCYMSRGRSTATIMQDILDLPPVTPKEKRRKWIRTTDKSGHLVWECDKCGWQQRFNTNFCPDCGARMVSE